jgi:transposase
MKSYLGIDIAKATFDVHLGQANERWTGQFANDPSGFARLHRWLMQRDVAELHSCMEATGTYGIALATFLHEQGFQVSIVNPKAIYHYAKSKLRRNKTDQLDARLLLEYCDKECPRLWQPAPEERQILQALTRRVSALKGNRTREINRLKAGTHPAFVEQSIQATIEFFTMQMNQLEEQVQQHIDQHPHTLAHSHHLLTSIPGIGAKMAALILSELPDVTFFKSAKQITAFAGLSPEQLQSGTTLRQRGFIKMGSPRLRTALYLPAIVGMRHNPILAALAERLTERGKGKMTIIGALMRKLLQLAYGVLKSQQPFDPDFVINIQTGS